MAAKKNRKGLGAALGGIAGTGLGFLAGGPIGAAIGGAAGGLMSDKIQSSVNKNNPQYGNNQPVPGRETQGSFWRGTPGGFEQTTPYAPWQLPYFQQLAQMGSQGLQDPYAGFQPIEEYARTQFQQQTVPSLAERFASLGSNTTSSPAFASQLGQAGAGLEQGLAAMRSQYGLENRGQLLQLLGLGLTPQYQSMSVPGTPGFRDRLMEAIGGVAPVAGRLGANALGAYLGAGQGQGGRAAWSAVTNGLQGV